MSYQAAKASYAEEIAEIKAAGLWKTERVIASEQKNDITLEGGANVVNMCANNYLGLANNAEVMQAASDSLERVGFWRRISALHLRHSGHSQNPRATRQPFSGHGRHHPLCRLF